MGFVSGTHWIGVFLLLAATVLLLIVTISAPVINDVALLKVKAEGGGLAGGSVNFGTFGYCIAGAGRDYCTGSHIGYDPAKLVETLHISSLEGLADTTAKDLTKVMVLHPIACGFAFIAFILAAGHGILGSLAGALVAFVAWVLTLASLAVDFTLFGIIYHRANNDTNGLLHASFGAAIWCVVGAFVALLLGMILVFLTCCANRREKRRNVVVEKQQSPPRRRKRFGIF